MNVTDKLQLIRALEEQESSRRRRGNLVAWGSVLLAALVMSVMIWAGHRELSDIERKVSSTQAELNGKQAELARVTASLARARAETDDALRNLQYKDGKPPSAYEIESAVDHLYEARNATRSPVTAPGPNASSRAQVIENLFNASPSVRVKAYGELLPLYKDDPTLIPELLRVARANPQNANGLYNTLVVLSHVNQESLRPHSNEIRSFAEASKSVGPRVAERSNTLLRRLPM